LETGGSLQDVRLLEFQDKGRFSHYPADLSWGSSEKIILRGNKSAISGQN